MVDVAEWDPPCMKECSISRSVFTKSRSLKIMHNHLIILFFKSPAIYNLLAYID
jgi:hypothetical protein